MLIFTNVYLRQPLSHGAATFSMAERFCCRHDTAAIATRLAYVTAGLWRNGADVGDAEGLLALMFQQSAFDFDRLPRHVQQLDGFVVDDHPWIAGEEFGG